MNKTRILYHVGFWLLAYVFWIYVFRNGTLTFTRTISIQFCYLVFISAIYYFNTFYTIPHLLNKRKYASFTVCFIGGVTVAALLRVPVSVLVSTYIFKAVNNHFDYLEIFYNSFINILFWVICILSATMVLEKVRSQRYIEQIEKEKATTELNFLRAQFNPHFLFNSINSIYGRIDKSNPQARDMLLVFSDMLRYQLYECNVEQIFLESEINYIRNYVVMQKSRMDERMVISFCADQITGQVNVAPLLFMAFIENAFKYVGFNENRQNKVVITLSYQNGNLQLVVFNTKDSFTGQAERSSGLGIANTKRRLEILYPGKHQLDINNTEEDYRVTLNLFDL